MSFDGFLSKQPTQESKPAVAQDQLSVSQQELAGSQRREADALVELKQAEEARDAFFIGAIGGARLNNDQKLLLQQLQSDFRLNRLQEVVHTDEASGASYTFENYFSHDAQGQDASDVLVVAKRLIREWEDAQSTRKMAARLVESGIKNAPNGEMPVNITETARYTLPKLEGMALPEIKGTEGMKVLERTFVSEFSKHEAGATAHMQNVEEFMKTPFTLPPLPGEAGYDRMMDGSAGRKSEDALPAVEPAPAPPVEAMPDPAAYASPEARTVVMPAVQQPKQNFASRAKAAFSRWFS